MTPLKTLTYICYYMDNDGQKQIVARLKGHAAYQRAVSYCQKNCYLYGTDLNYQSEIK